MPFLVQGNAQETFTHFGKDFLIAAGAEQRHIIIGDLPRTFFFGTAEQNRQHVEIWSDPEQTPASCYAQGNMSAANLYLLFGNICPATFFNAEELYEHSFVEKKLMKISRINFAYIDQSGNPRGLLLYYRQDDPSKWIIGQSKNGNKLPEETEVKILTSFDPNPLQVMETGCKIKQVPLEDRAFIEALDSPPLEKFIRHVIDEEGKIKPAAKLINLFLQNVNTEGMYPPNDELLASFADFDDEIMHFMLKNDAKSQYFCQAVLKIEAETAAIRNRLHRENPEKLELLENGPERAYRHDLYRAMYNSLTDELTPSDEKKAELKRKIHAAEAHIDEIINVDQYPWLRKAKQLIANLVMGLLTVATLGVAGAAFYLHHERTGDWLFFARPTSAEDYRTLNGETFSETAELIEDSVQHSLT